MCDFCFLFDFANTRCKVDNGIAVIETNELFPFPVKEQFNFCPMCGSPVKEESSVSNNFPANLRRIRKMRGITQEALGKKLNVQKSAISKYEKGRTKPNVSQLYILCRVLDVSPQELI